MAHLVPKLNLNKTPQTAEDGSMIFAKNILLLKDGNIGRDYGQKKINNNIISSLQFEFRTLIRYGNLSSSEITIVNKYNKILTTSGVQYKLISVIPYNHVFYALYRISTTINYFDIIVKHEENGSIEIVRSAWKYNGGTITGNVQINLNDDIILTICESFDDTKNNPLVPIKTLNLTYSKFDDDESIYTQAPNIPIVNLNLKEYYTKTIPNGVYQFFIRYKIREGHYTQWIPCSTELHTGNTKLLSTQQGSVKYTDIHEDSDKSFVFSVDKEVDYQNNFIKFQLGFIISHDDETYARTWKHFDIDTSEIYFDYNTNDITEIDITELLNPIYQLYNVKNITNFKNKQYVSNYIETDFAPKINKALLDRIKVDIVLDETGTTTVTYEGYSTESRLNDGNYYIETIEGKPVNDIISSLVKNNLEKVKFPWYISDDEQYNPDSGIEENYGIKVFAYCGNKNRIYDKALLAESDYGQYGFKMNVESSGVNWEFEVKDDFDPGDVDDRLATIDNLYNRLKSIVKYIHNGKIYDSNFNEITIAQGVWMCNGDSVDYNPPDPSGQKRATYYKLNMELEFDIKNEKVDRVIKNKNFNTTLLPYKVYNFYIHFVKQTGEITNGYLVKTVDLKTHKVIGTSGNEYSGARLLYECLTNHNILYPKFGYNIKIGELTPEEIIPSEYVAYFFTIADVKRDISEINVFKKKDDTVYGQSLEVTTRLKPYINDIQVVEVDYDGRRTYERTVTGNYCSSSDPTNLNAYGSVGVISLPGDMDITKSSLIIDETSRENSIFDLVKCTPYIANSSPYKVYNVGNNNLNLLGFLASINPLPIELDNFYSGTDAYNKLIADDGISLSEIAMPKIRPYSQTAQEYVYSEYDLDHLALTEDYIFKIKGANESGYQGEKILVVSKDSQLLSEVYTLPKMYYEFTRKTYVAYDENNILKINFSNTIRSSKLSSDESIINNYYFPPTDYYNIPTNKGIITNLVAVGNGILVHTEDSLFKFNGNNSISASGGEDIQLNESEVFDTGISEIFGSQYGFGGLKYKTDSIVIEQGYIFYDTDSRIIYMYSGEGQNKPISNSIDKLLKSMKVEHIYFANDFYNDRVFMLIKEQTNTLVLTYNLVLKDFISIHDITYDKSFNTKTKCYFIKGDNIYTIDETSLEYNIDLINYTNHYPKHTSDPISNKKPSSIIDVMFNTSYELVKTLNSISWICGKVTDFNNDEDVNLAEELLDYSYKGDYVQIYTDSCATDQIPLRGRSNDTSIDVTNPDTVYAKFDADSYLKPYFEKGRWNLNYFRDIKNITKTLNVGRETYISDDNSLIYGKYIVCRFIFESGNNFKFENLFVNTETL